MRTLLVLSAGLLMACSSSDTPKIEKGAEMLLAGSEWNMGQNTEAFFAFKSDGRIIGHGGCNSFSGSYEQNDTRLKIGPLASTKKMCPPDIMAVENTLMEILGKTQFYDATHMTLTLNDAEGQTLMKFQRSDWD